MEKKIILLVSAEVVRNMTGISDNVASGYLLTSIQEAQEIRLKNVLGSSLLSKLKDLISKSELDLPENSKYEELVSQLQYYLAYQSVVEVIGKVAFKVGNYGVMRSSDDRASQATYDEVIARKSDYQGKADYYCMELQSWLLDHRPEFPELGEGQCHRIKSNLTSSASCGIFLGGARGKRL